MGGTGGGGRMAGRAGRDGRRAAGAARASGGPGRATCSWLRDARVRTCGERRCAWWTTYDDRGLPGGGGGGTNRGRDLPAAVRGPAAGGAQRLLRGRRVRA